MVQKIVAFDVALKSTERQWVQKVPEVYTNDLGSVSLQFRITDCTDTELTGSTAIVLLKMRDGSFFQGPSVDVTRTLNVFSYTLKENEGNHDGLAEIQLLVTIGAKEFATQKYNFKVITGLDSEVAREIMIYDWSTLTAEARAYIDQFTADEVLRDAEFDNAQFDRNAEFNAAQTQRVIAFNSSEAARVSLFNSKETARAAGYDVDHSRAETDHTGAITDHTNAETDRTNAATDRTNAAVDRTLAGTDHTRAEADHTRADADSATVAGFNGRLTDVETLYQEKANKVQEAWITPTLINGAIQDPSHPVQYYKDQFGRVYFRGKARNVPNDKPLFTMPTGYRAPANESYTSMIVPRSASVASVARIIIDGGWGRGVVYAIIPATDIVHFDGFNYSVEG